MEYSWCRRNPIVSFCKANNIHYLIIHKRQISTELGGHNGKEKSALIVLHLVRCPENCELGTWPLKEEKIELWQKSENMPNE